MLQLSNIWEFSSSNYIFQGLPQCFYGTLTSSSKTLFFIHSLEDLLVNLELLSSCLIYLLFIFGRQKACCSSLWSPIQAEFMLPSVTERHPGTEVAKYFQILIQLVSHLNLNSSGSSRWYTSHSLLHFYFLKELLCKVGWAKTKLLAQRYSVSGSNNQERPMVILPSRFLYCFTPRDRILPNWSTLLSTTSIYSENC